MMIQQLDFSPNEKVLCEIEAIEGTRNLLQDRVEEADTLADYCHSFLTSVSGYEFLDKIDHSRKMKVLDIGFGGGETSLYLASKGHDVYAIEPSPLNCEILEKAAKKFGQKIHIYQGTAEHFDQIDEHNFDLCLFYSSLHHCDTPVKALQICRDKLKNTGRVLALNEPILKFYRSKKWFHDKLENDPASVGHYGGNEHIYYYHEYVDLFKKAGFASVRGMLNIRNLHPRLVIKEDIPREIGGNYVHSDGKLLLKFFILYLLKNLWSKPLIALGKKFSLFPYSFEAKIEA